MGSYKLVAYIAIGIALAAYASWLKKAKVEGRAESFWHKDITIHLFVIGGIGFLIAYVAELLE